MYTVSAGNSFLTLNSLGIAQKQSNFSMFFKHFDVEQESWVMFDNEAPPPLPPMATNPGHQEYLHPRPAPRKAPPLPKPYAVSKSEKEQQGAAAASESKPS